MPTFENQNTAATLIGWGALLFTFLTYLVVNDVVAVGTLVVCAVALNCLVLGYLLVGKVLTAVLEWGEGFGWHLAGFVQFLLILVTIVELEPLLATGAQKVVVLGVLLFQPVILLSVCFNRAKSMRASL